MTIAGAYNDPRAMRRAMGAEAYTAQMRDSTELLQRQYDTGDTEYMPAVAPEGQPAAMGGQEPYDYYGTSRGLAGAWENRVTRLSIRSLLTFDAAGAADFLDATSLCVIHRCTDDYCSPEGAQALYDRAPGPKDILWLDTTNHIDLYDVPDYVDPAVARASRWLAEHLAAAPTESDAPARA